QAGGASPAMRIDLPAFAGALGIDCDNDALRADDARGLAHEFWRLHGGGVDRYLVGAGVEEAPHIGDAAHAAADGERDEHLRGDRLDDVQQDVALIGARGDVEETQFIGAIRVVARGDFDRVAGVAQADEIDALHHPAGGDVEAGDDAFSEPHYFLPSALSAAACAVLSSSFPS